LLVSQHRPGFYLRVIREGHVHAGDDIVLTRRGRHELSVADVDALLYLPDRNLEQLRKVVDVSALSPGWMQSFHDLLAEHDAGRAPTAPAIGVEPGWSGFRELKVSAVRRESPSVTSICLAAEDHTVLPRPRPGQYLTIRIPGEPAPMRSYSLSGDPTARDYRISVKREDRGQVSRWLHDHVQPGSVLDVAAPRGDFILTDADTAVVLISAGIGVTPVLAMLHSLAAANSTREIWWLHTVRDAPSQAFAAEAQALIESLPHARQRVFYSRRGDRMDRQALDALGLPTDASVYVCGPDQFMTDMRDALTAAGVDPAKIHSELFGALPAINPGVVVDSSPRTPPHPPAGAPGPGPAISFARSGLSVEWSPGYGTILDLAESCDVPTRFACRSGVCHVCETGIVDGSVSYVQSPLEPPGPGSVLICSAAPASDLVLDL
jgi:ferredoxin-NADP reductase